MKELRKVKVTYEINGSNDPEKYYANGYFHKWIEQTSTGDNEKLVIDNYAIVEMEKDGRIILFGPKQLKFVKEF
jgi:hypothetical protein